MDNWLGIMSVSTCFLFVQTLESETYDCVSLDDQGEVIAELAVRDVAAIKALQQQAYTIMVLPSERAMLSVVDLPWLSERKARAVIPYALEEQAAQAVDSLHFAFDRAHYSQQQYRVAAIDKQYFTELVAHFDALGIAFDAVTFDWFALALGEACKLSDSLLVHHADFAGALQADTVSVYCQQQPMFDVFVFPDSAKDWEIPVTKNLVSTFSRLWIAQRLLKNPGINLCQAAYQRKTQRYDARFWYTLSVGIIALWLLSMPLMSALGMVILSHHTKKIDQQIAQIYYQLFPNAKQVISPRFRMGQLLKSEQYRTGEFWLLLAKLAQAYDAKQITIEQIRFQNAVLNVRLTGREFAALVRMEEALQRAQVHVKQVQAASGTEGVAATLELSL